MGVELFPYGWNAPRSIPARDSAEFAFTTAGRDTLHVRVAARPVGLSALTMSVRAEDGRLVELSGVPIEVFDGADRKNPAGTAFVEDEGHGVHRIFIELNRIGQQWTIIADNTADATVGINAVAAGTDDEAMRPWIALSQEVRIVEDCPRPIPSRISVQFCNWGTGTLSIDQDNDPGVAGEYMLENVDPDRIEPGGVGTLTWAIGTEGDTSTRQTIKCNDPDTSHTLIRPAADSRYLLDRLRSPQRQ
ncbi:hypothetical protein [Nocardia gamkensis]|uniref:Uncharacterized protein n=1 Tax=Nocardia gamkensis TaxID=352869 RepID=A0A7X6R1Y9_9NOCA|nr:hypothetical protein [Nocardia gamkensis]NKY25869.1 hypothetical protein [Nocardia gamkensis]NQE68938.1 hypothetical protein [Nocardia gamkensis]